MTATVNTDSAVSEGVSLYDEYKEAFYDEPAPAFRDATLQWNTKLPVDWSKFQDPFQIIPPQYYMIQAEKERMLVNNYELISRYNLSQDFDARWLQLIRLAMVALPGPEYAIGSAFGAAALRVPGARWRLGVMAQMFDEHRHGQNDLRNAAEINKEFPGVFSKRVTQFNHMWLMQIIRNYFEDVNATLSRDVLEAVVGLNYCLEVALSNIIFGGLPAVSVQSNDTRTAQHFMSIQSDESRHMSLGNEMLRFALENASDSGNMEIVEYWLHKWMWRTYRALMPPVAVAADVYSTNRAESYGELYKRYVSEGVVKNLLAPLQKRYGFKMPRSLETMNAEVPYFSSTLWQLLYAYKRISPILVPAVNDADRQWLTGKYPDWEPTFGQWWSEVAAGDGKDETNIPTICHVCQLPCVMPLFHDPQLFHAQYRGESLTFCSEHCREIFTNEPEIYGPVRDQGQRIVGMMQAGMTMPELVGWLGVPQDVLENGGILAEATEA